MRKGQAGRGGLGRDCRPCGSLFLGLMFRNSSGSERYFVLLCGRVTVRKREYTFYLDGGRSCALAEATMEAGPVTDPWLELKHRCSSKGEGPSICPEVRRCGPINPRRHGRQVRVRRYLVLDEGTLTPAATHKGTSSSESRRGHVLSSTLDRTTP